MTVSWGAVRWLVLYGSRKVGLTLSGSAVVCSKICGERKEAEEIELTVVGSIIMRSKVCEGWLGVMGAVHPAPFGQVMSIQPPMVCLGVEELSLSKTKKDPNSSGGVREFWNIEP